MAMQNETMDDGLEADYAAPESEQKPESIDEQEQEAMANKAVIPQAVLTHGGEKPKVGDICKVKVVALNGDDEATIIYAPEGQEEEGESPEGEGMGEEMSPDEEIDSLDKY